MAVLDTIEVTVGDRAFNDVDAAFSYFAERARGVIGSGLTTVIRRDMLNTLRRIHADMAETHGKSWNGRMPTGVNHLFSRSGDSLNDILRSLKTTGSFKDEVVGELRITGTMVIHEAGGTITRKKAKYMTIPLPAACDKRGLPLKASSRDWDNTFVARSKRGNLLIFQRRGRAVVPLYLLKTSVYMPARLRTMEHMEGQLPYFEQRMFEAVSNALEKF